jgi:radical SAM protein with 4Fe4S-binding SPASM domain
MTVPDFTFANAPCHRPLIRMLIQHDGEVCNCCEDTHGDFKLGNVYEHSLEQLWFSERHVQVVHDLVEGRREKYSLCRNCPLSPTGPAPSRKKIQIELRNRAVEKSA